MLSTHAKLKYTTGAKRNPEKEGVPYLFAGAVSLPPSLITNISILPVLDQAQQEACVGHAAANMVNFDYWKKTGLVPNLSPRWAYDVAKMVDGYPTGNGTSAAACVQGLHTYEGFATIATYPNDVTLPIPVYSTLDTNAVSRVDAFNFPVLNGVEIQNAITDIQLKTLIYQYGIVMIAVAVDQDTWMNHDGLVSLRPGTVGLHEVIIYGYETVGNDTVFHVRNSWGLGWGKNGVGTFLWSDYKNNIYDAMSITIDMNPVPNYTQSFANAVNNTLFYEGGYTNDPNDPGGETNFGISKRSYPNVDIKNLTRDHAIQIYWTDFWQKISGDSMFSGLAFNVFDTAVNIGVTPAVKMLQTALGVVSDGVIGPKTIAAMKAAQPSVVGIFGALRAEYYFTLAKYPIFGKTWISRTIGTIINSIKTT